jgi:hypothetical protein
LELHGTPGEGRQAALAVVRLPRDYGANEKMVQTDIR